MINNPVLRKELLLRMRVRQPTATRVGAALAIVLLLGFIYDKVIFGLMGDSNPQSGLDAWYGTMWVQFILMVLVAPSITANAIAKEKEQQTWEMLLFTRLLPSEIVFGKLLARMVGILILLIIGLPIAIFSALHADKNGPASTTYISLGRFLGAYLTLWLCGLFFATFGLFVSWLLSRTIYAIITAYTFVIGGLIMCTAFVSGLLAELISDPGFFSKCPLIWFNPVLMMQEAIAPASRQDTVFLVYGLVGYVLLTSLLLWRMIAGFRRFAYES